MMIMIIITIKIIRIKTARINMMMIMIAHTAIIGKITTSARVATSTTNITDKTATGETAYGRRYARVRAVRVVSIVAIRGRGVAVAVVSSSVTTAHAAAYSASYRRRRAVLIIRVCLF